MNSIAQRLDRIAIGENQQFKNLTMFPLLDNEPCEADYLLLEEALESGAAHVTEVVESGSVPELKFVNEADKPVLLLDGEELVGAKQNRIINLTLLVAAKATIVIPVSCVEQGRWRADSSKFSAAKRTHFATGRARKANRVSESMNRSGSRRTDQSEVWEDIEVKFRRMQTDSPTRAAAAMYEKNRAGLDDFEKAFTPADNQTGALFAINGKAIGFDLFDSSKPFKTMISSLVQSYALDAIDSLDEKSAEIKVSGVQLAQKFLEDCARSQVNRFPALGEGYDLRLKGDGLTGGALEVNERVLHLCAFRLAESNPENRTRRNRMARPSARREHRIVD